MAAQQTTTEITTSGPTVAVAVKASIGDVVGGSGSRRAVRWAVNNLLSTADRFVLVHVIPAITTIPTPSGERILLDKLDENDVSLYVQDMKVEYEQVFFPFKRLCKSSKVETLLLEDQDPAKALLRYVSESGVNSLVMGSFASNVFTRKPKDSEVPATVLRNAPETCEVYIVCKDKIMTRSVDTLSLGESSNRFSDCLVEGCTEVLKGSVSEPSNNASEELTQIKPLGVPSIPQCTSSVLHTYATASASTETSVHAKTNPTSSENNTKSTAFQQSDAQAEIVRVRIELQNTVLLYEKSCEELVRMQTKIQLLSSECHDEEIRAAAALERVEMLRKVATEERERHLTAMKKVEEAKALLAAEFCERRIAELNALRGYMEKQKLVHQLFLSDKRYKRYTMSEIDVATDSFSQSNLIGEGGFGKVYRCSLDHTPVAVKVLEPGSFDKKEEFLKEVEVLSQLRHPHIVLLLGACPEYGCLVYEYLENGSLQDYILHQEGKPFLPWFVRFRIIFEVASGIAFLHNSKPEPIIHRDLKPDNILLDRNFVCKIGDVGLAKFVSDVIPDDLTVYGNSILAGTLHYMDPEYQRTGTIRPKSDVYALGIIILQLLTGRHPKGLLSNVEKAMKRGSFFELLDKSVMDWPLAEAKELADIALNCSSLRCRDRPDLDEVLPVLKRLLDDANAKVHMLRDNLHPPSHYFCPVLQTLMNDPHIAADGFTYERRAIELWLARHKVSPKTNKRLPHFLLIPNHTLRSAIQNWKALATLSSAQVEQAEAVGI